MDFDLNYIAVLVAAVVSMIIGAAWYSKFLFGGMWMKLMHFSDADMAKAKEKGMGKSYALGFVSQLVMATILGSLLKMLGASDVSSALATAFWVWLGFIATTMSHTVLWENRPWKLYGINSLYWLVGLGVMATVLVMM